jgi:hypothetical protein
MQILDLNGTGRGQYAAAELRAVKELVWDLVSAYLQPAEREEVRAHLSSCNPKGESLHLPACMAALHACKTLHA